MTSASRGKSTEAASARSPRAHRITTIKQALLHRVFVFGTRPALNCHLKVQVPLDSGDLAAAWQAAAETNSSGALGAPLSQAEVAVLVSAFGRHAHSRWQWTTASESVLMDRLIDAVLVGESQQLAQSQVLCFTTAVSSLRGECCICATRGRALLRLRMHWQRPLSREGRRAAYLRFLHSSCFKKHGYCRCTGGPHRTHLQRRQCGCSCRTRAPLSPPLPILTGPPPPRQLQHHCRRRCTSSTCMATHCAAPPPPCP